MLIKKLNVQGSLQHDYLVWRQNQKNKYLVQSSIPFLNLCNGCFFLFGIMFSPFWGFLFYDKISLWWWFLNWYFKMVDYLDWLELDVQSNNIYNVKKKKVDVCETIEVCEIVCYFFKQNRLTMWFLILMQLIGTMVGNIRNFKWKWTSKAEKLFVFQVRLFTTRLILFFLNG